VRLQAFCARRTWCWLRRVVEAGMIKAKVNFASPTDGRGSDLPLAHRSRCLRLVHLTVYDWSWRGFRSDLNFVRSSAFNLTRPIECPVVGGGGLLLLPSRSERTSCGPVRRMCNGISNTRAGFISLAWKSYGRAPLRMITAMTSSLDSCRTRRRSEAAHGSN